MQSRLRTTMLAAVVAALGALTSGTAARANIVFDFSGVCLIGCSGNAMAVLTFTSDYLVGSDFTPATFTSLTYTSSDASFTIPVADASILVGGLNADGSFNSAGVVDIRSSADFFVAAPGQFVGGPDLGSQFQFSLVAVPEPGAWALMTIGFAALGVVGYRRA